MNIIPGTGDECKIEELKGGRKRRKEVERARPGLLCRSDVGRGYKTVYWGARPGTAKLAGSSNSQVPILQRQFDITDKNLIECERPNKKYSKYMK